MSRMFTLAAFASLTAVAVEPQSQSPKAHFMSTVQVAVEEPTPQLLRRSQRLVREEFYNAFNNRPEFRKKNFEMRVLGNEMIFSVVTEEDIRPTIQLAVAEMIDHLNGRVQARGKSLFYRTNLSPELGGYLEVRVEEDAKTRTKRIRSIAAQSVPLRELLKEIRFQMGSLSYLIPGECAERLIDWSFGGDDTLPSDVDTLLKQLARSLGISCENLNGTFVFTGPCPEEAARRRPRRPPPSDLLPGGLVPSHPTAAQPIFFPLLPLE